jgi:uroporphyrin-III C-methyltransferase
MPDLVEPGSVWLVGAGPGDPDLLTRKAEKLICAADIIFHDALVGQTVLDLVPPHIELVSVGKRSGRHSKEQRSINDLMIEAALSGKRVVRLKGGDPSIFGRSAEEMAALSLHNIPVSVCPGITAASAAAASAKLSLTLRGLARKLVFVTAHARAGEALDLDWSALADPQATLAIYMGKAAVGEVTAALQDNGLAAQTPALIVENASLPNECITFTSLSRLAKTAKLVVGNGPALVLIGRAVLTSSLPLHRKPFGVDNAACDPAKAALRSQQAQCLTTGQVPPVAGNERKAGFGGPI